MVRIRHSSSNRPRVRFRTGREEPPVARRPTTVAGVKIPDPAMVELLLDAESQGFRIEPSTGQGGHAAGTGFTVYPPSKEHTPLFVGCVEVNSRHVANVRSQLRAAGYVTGGSVTEEPATTTTEENAVPTGTRKAPAKNAGQSVADRINAALHTPVDSAVLAQQAFDQLPYDDRVMAAMKGVASMGSAVGMTDNVAALAALLLQTVADWERNSERYDNADLQAALKLAEENEQRAIKAERKQAEAEKRGSETGRLLTETREQLAAVTAERDEMKKALDPLRALLGK